jgi:hypothetical protein
MCQFVEIKKDAVPSNIGIEFERDASLRAVEMVVINHDRDGAERQAVKLILEDSGKITYAGKPQDLRDGVDIV